VSRPRWFERVGPREQLTLTATEREVDGWRVAATIAGERLAEWAVLALNETARASIAARVGGANGASPGDDSTPTARPAPPGPESAP
jgi:hypothetical protein